MKALEHRCEENALHVPNVQDEKRKNYQWYAPRVLMTCWEHVTQGAEPTQWRLDSYDGCTIWVEMHMMPDESDRRDANPTITQQRELGPKIMQSQIETDELLERNPTGCNAEANGNASRKKCDQRSSKCLKEWNTSARQWRRWVEQFKQSVVRIQKERKAM